MAVEKHDEADEARAVPTSEPEGAADARAVRTDDALPMEARAVGIEEFIEPALEEADRTLEARAVWIEEFIEPALPEADRTLDARAV